MKFDKLLLPAMIFFFLEISSIYGGSKKNYKSPYLRNIFPSKLKIWINAFIPNDILGVSTIQVGPHFGENAIIGPLPSSGLFLTDQRSFDSDLDCLSRMHSLIEIDLNSFSILNIENRCKKTIEVDGFSGEEKCSIIASSAGILIKNFTVGENPSGKKMINFTFYAEGANPCYLIAPNIIWQIPVTLLLDTHNSKLSIIIDGFTTAFPAFEMYGQVDHENPIVIFQRYPEINSSPWALLLSPNLQIFKAEYLN